jgi:hypothetical protein
MIVELIKIKLYLMVKNEGPLFNFNIFLSLARQLPSGAALFIPPYIFVRFYFVILYILVANKLQVYLFA